MKTAAFIALFALSIAANGEAAERFRPAASDYVVMRVPARASSDPIAVLEQRHAQSPQDQAVATTLASLYLDRARTDREPRYFGRAEMLLEPWLARTDASSAALRAQADILQNRHDFSGARKLLDRAIGQTPRDPGTRLMRASVLLVEGQPREARADCAAVMASGEAMSGTICLAQVLGNTGNLQQAEALLATAVTREREQALPPAVRAWALWLQADFADRQGDAPLAERSLRAALIASPANEGVRSALSDALAARGAWGEVLNTVNVPQPSVGLLIRRARAQQALHDTGEARTRQQIDDLLALASRRGERPHLREEALLALDIDRDAERALRLARENFQSQRETIDARLLARASRSAGEASAPPELSAWLRETGFQDRELTGNRT